MDNTHGFCLVFASYYPCVFSSAAFLYVIEILALGCIGFVFGLHLIFGIPYIHNTDWIGNPARCISRGGPFGGPGSRRRRLP